MKRLQIESTGRNAEPVTYTSEQFSGLRALAGFVQDALFLREKGMREQELRPPVTAKLPQLKNGAGLRGYSLERPFRIQRLFSSRLPERMLFQ
jgi:hypothetical protein